MFLKNMDPVRRRIPANNDWQIVTVTEPLLWSRSETETWLLNPNTRYVLNASQIESLEGKVETMSELKASSLYTPLTLGKPMAQAKILVERHRNRGFGDYLFLTGPLNYIQHISGYTAKITLYALADRGQLMENNPALAYRCPLVGPILYDNLKNFHYHWFVDSVTEYDEEPDQLNVYDALYRQLGIDPTSVPERFKRPTLTLVEKDYKDLNALYHFIYSHKKQDLRRQPFYVVAPTANSDLRSSPYVTWLKSIHELSKDQVVVVVGQNNSVRAPAPDIPYGSFIDQLDNMGPNVINLIGNTPIRVTAAMISQARCVFTLDSGLLYVAQALRVPCVSLWGPIGPWARIGYDKDYLKLAIHNKGTCRYAPCFAYDRFPIEKCPRGAMQTACEPLISVTPAQIVAKAHEVEKMLEVSQEPDDQVPVNRGERAQLNRPDDELRINPAEPV